MLYPEQRYISELTVIRRECRLPDGAVGTVNVAEGKRVEVRDEIGRASCRERV